MSRRRIFPRSTTPSPRPPNPSSPLPRSSTSPPPSSSLITRAPRSPPRSSSKRTPNHASHNPRPSSPKVPNNPPWGGTRNPGGGVHLPSGGGTHLPPAASAWRLPPLPLTRVRGARATSLARDVVAFARGKRHLLPPQRTQLPSEWKQLRKRECGKLRREFGVRARGGGDTPLAETWARYPPAVEPTWKS